jgi:SpoVK/Ycf46/Vps4 family AAA+-type ATPase
MEHLVKKYIAALVRAGMTGSRSNFALAVGNFISRIKHSDQEFARELSSLVSKESILRAEALPLIPADIDSRMDLLEIIYPVVAEVEPALSDASKEILDQVLKEWRNLDVLIKAKLAPARLLLFHGQPGTGKTLVAHWLAEQLDLPLLTLNLTCLIGSFPDKTDSNVRAVFAHAMQRPCVLLLDEFEALARQPAEAGNAGELKHLLNVLLRALDEWPADSLLIAASNHGDLLDAAVLRRFDHLLTFANPDAALIEAYLSRVEMEPEIEPGIRENLATLLQGESFSAIQQLISGARKIALLDQQDLIRTLVKNAIFLRTEHGNKDKENGLKPHEGEMLLMYMEGHSLREIGQAFDKSHPTVGRIIKRYLGGGET